MGFFHTLKQAASDFSDDDCMSSGAAMAYYAIFSLPPLLVLVAMIAGYFGVDQEQMNELVAEQMGMSGSSDTLAQAENSKTGGGSGGGGSLGDSLGIVWKIVGILVLVFSATGLFAQLQYSLNRAWEVKPDPQKGGVFAFIFKRILSFGMIVVVFFLLLVSLVLTTVIDEITSMIQGGSPEGVALAIGIVLNNLATFLVAMLLFAAMFKVLPDAKMAWRDVWVGAAMTALLFVIGKALIGWYVQSADVGSTWGSAAASLIGVLVWFYYASLIVLFGAELTQAWAKAQGRGIEPAEGAVPAKTVLG
jgi:membrane protein